MRLLLIFLGAIGLAVLIFIVGNWYVLPFITRQVVLQRLNRPSDVVRLSRRFTRYHRPATKQSAQLEKLSCLSEFLDTTARNLRLGKSMASALKTANDTCEINEAIINELVALTTRGESIADAVNGLLPNAITNELVFTMRTIDLAATGGVGGVMGLERAAIVLRERSTHINDRQMQASQAMLSTKVLSWAPVVVASWLIMTSSSVRNFLILSTSGWLCILFGIGCNYAGRRWMRAIVATSPL